MVYCIFILGCVSSLVLNYINYDKLYKIAYNELSKTTNKVKPEDYNLNMAIISPLVCLLMSTMLNELYTQLIRFFKPITTYFILTSIMLFQNRVSEGNTVTWITSCIEVIVLMYTNPNYLAVLKLIVNLQMIQIQKHAYREVYADHYRTEVTSMTEVDCGNIKKEPVTTREYKVRRINVMPA